MDAVSECSTGVRRPYIKLCRNHVVKYGFLSYRELDEMVWDTRRLRSRVVV